MGYLIKQSNVATWFQTRVVYKFYKSLPQIIISFVYALQVEGKLKGVVVGYITNESNAIKQLLTRRAIIVGGQLFYSISLNVPPFINHVPVFKGSLLHGLLRFDNVSLWQR